MSFGTPAAIFGSLARLIPGVAVFGPPPPPLLVPLSLSLPQPAASSAASKTITTPRSVFLIGSPLPFVRSLRCTRYPAGSERNIPRHRGGPCARLNPLHYTF